MSADISTNTQSIYRLRYMSVDRSVDMSVDRSVNMSTDVSVDMSTDILTKIVCLTVGRHVDR